MTHASVIVFVCEHGAAKSIIAAAYFNHLATEMGLDLRAVARGTNPDMQLSPQAVKGLSEDGLTPQESAPQQLMQTDIQSAQRIIAFCELPAEYQRQAAIERWDGVPPISEDYKEARDAIIERLHHLMKK